MDEVIVGGAGVPDSWSRIWVPHRMAYIKGENRPNSADADLCPFCRIQDLSDDQALIVHRGVEAFVVLNLYPYNAGHVLICTKRHIADYTELSESEVLEVAQLARKAMIVLRAVSNAHGFNLGINQGAIAGAGVAPHFHQHVVPRWGGDANFMPIIGRTRPMPQMLSETRELLAAEWSKN